MKRVAVFGNTGGGKSTLARRLGDLTRLPVYPLDLIQFRRGGGEVPREVYLAAHAELLQRDQWIIDGFGCMASTRERFSMADTLVYVDLPLAVHAWWVTKRLLLSPYTVPEGWPADSPIWDSTLNSYRVLWRCHRGLTPRYRQLAATASATKRVHHLRSPARIKAFLELVEHEALRRPG
jgi:adenylate kinase family enzyme